MLNIHAGFSTYLLKSHHVCVGFWFRLIQVRLKVLFILQFLNPQIRNSGLSGLGIYATVLVRLADEGKSIHE
jgi:hypothetical protein